MKKLNSALLILFAFVVSIQAQVQSLPKLPKGLNFIVANDMGRQGYYEQKPIAKIMGEVAEQNSIEFVALAGDSHHYMGVASVSDPRWMTNFELIYDNPELQIPWNVILGNHEYKGNTQAVLDYTHISRRWNAPARYYSIEMKIGKGDDKCLFVYIDTPPLIDKYREEKDEYPDACKQDINEQLKWMESTLSKSDARWKFVIGHHPVYADTGKDISERSDMQKRIGGILENNAVDFYICGHIHNFQYIKPQGKKVNYIVNSAAALSRSVNPVDGTIFCNGDPGFSVFTVSKDAVEFYFINHKAEVIYSNKVVK
ncbi:metallophosphoesterase [Dysgonomonas termitidis]|uniref:acid phosphatase n=1 Tax=Dysgonomonas termitidis TaxID=1516126 RepID=A0ABV9L2N6_9BACT